MKNLIKVFLFSIIFVIAGCAVKVPSPEVMKAKVADFKLPKLPEDGKALVYVMRPAGGGGLFKFYVFVDDHEPESEMGYTKGAEYIYFNIEPGAHIISSKAENWSELKVTANPGEIIFIKQKFRRGAFYPRNTLLVINALEGKYHIKNSDLGTIHKADK